MKLVMKYQISAITFFVTFFSDTIGDTNLIFGHKLHIGTPYRGERFWIHQIPKKRFPQKGVPI
jgi:hypothetical protein